MIDRPSYALLPLADVTELVAHGKPAPGGIPAASISAALGAALVRMGAALATQSGTRDEAVAGAALRLSDVPQRLLRLADADSAALAAVLAAVRLPRGTDAERTARAETIQGAMARATEVPLDVMAAIAHALGGAARVMPHVPARARPDVAIGVELLATALHACAACATGNAARLTDTELAARLTRTREQIEAAAARHLTQARAAATAPRS